METAKKRKTTAVITAVVIAVAIVLTGTFAWQSISQTALNETMSAVNPGGRLHDDFDGRNKDVYVENFTDPENGGVPIYARVRLDEYMEIGPGAGLKTGDAGAADKKAESLIKGADLNNVNTWETHIFGNTNDPFHEYWGWETGGQTMYMPTFNRNKDSLKADINGTYAGFDNDITTGTPFDDYKDYSDPNNSSVTADEVYDNDTNDVDEGDIRTVPQQTHKATSTLNGTLMSMEDWQNATTKPENCWVYDTDGWAYWSSPIAPGTATGLLLDGITLQKQPDDNWYYGINVVGQFATRGDWGSAETGDGFFGPNAGHEPTANALNLLNKISGITADSNSLTVTADGNVTEVLPGNTVQFSVLEADEVTWTVSGGTPDVTTISETGLLTVGESEAAGTVLTVTATSKTSAKTGSCTVTVKEAASEGPWNTDLAAITPGSTDTVAIDGREWYVLAKKDGKALIWAKEMETTFGTAGKGQFSPSFTENGSLWQNSGARTWLNSDYLESLSTLKEHAVETTVTTRKELATAEWYETTDKVFLLSEADLFGTVNKEATSEAKDYTYGTSQLVPNIEMRKCQSSGDFVNASCYWLRSLHANNYIVACCYSERGEVIFDYPNGTNAGIRPAMWVNLAS